MTGNGRPGNGNGPRNGRSPHGSRRRQRLRRKRQRSFSKRFVFLFFGGGLFGTIAILAAAAFTGAGAFASSCTLSSLQAVAIGQNSFVYAADGSLLGSIPAERNRQPLALSEMSPWLGEATVAIEDRRFYQHGGLDYEGILRAALKNIEKGQVVQGGSTITQQLVRNLYIGNERSLKRKIKEACLAIKLERHWSKDQILETYMNQIYYGNHAYGVEAAAETYFSQHAKDLDLAESALLAGLPQAPSIYDPFRRPDEAVRRRNEVLQAMLVNRDITPPQYQDALQTPLQLHAGEIYTQIKEPYFFSYVRDELIAKYGAAKVRSGGLRIYTTLDRRFQRLARKAIRDTLNEKGDPAAALVAINPKNGAIRAMASIAPGRKNLQFNLAAQGRRQAGSSFKTFVLTEAIQQGINPDATAYLSAPFHWQPDPQSEPWDVRTYDNSYYGMSSITASTLRSDNSVYARLTLDVGPEKVAEIAQEMGIQTKLQPVASIGLGSNSVSVLEMASAYATLAAGGVYSAPMAIRKVILPDGREDDEAGWGRASRRRVLSDGVAWQVTRILEQNVLAGTGRGAYFGRPAAGKTGTTDKHTDAWLVGYTPVLAAAVWVGYPNAEIEMTNVHGIAVAGGTFPATIWRTFMSPALSPTRVADWPAPLTQVIWKPFRGQYEFAGAPATPATTTTEAPPARPAVTAIEPAPSEPPAASTSAEPPPADSTPPPTTSAADTGVVPQ